MAEKIYIRNAASGALEPLIEERFETEDLLQELIGQHPELLAGDQMRPDEPLRWILVQREMPVEGWAIDHLLLDQDARPTLVEVKRGASSDNRRKVVGQMLDYAATAAGVWSGDGMRRAFEEDSSKRGADPLEELRKLLQPDDETDAEDLADEFWERAATNLAANRLRLLFVADEIPLELERVVKFLNEQTRDNLEVLAVEVKQYPGQFGDALVSRVIGQIDTPRETRSVGRSPRLTLDEFLARFRDDVRDAIESLMSAAGQINSNPRDTFRMGSASMSIRARCSVWPNPVSLCLLWLPNDNNPDGTFAFHADFWSDYDYPPPLRSILENWTGQFENDGRGRIFRSRNRVRTEHDGNEFVAHIDLLTERLRGVLSELAEL